MSRGEYMPWAALAAAVIAQALKDSKGGDADADVFLESEWRDCLEWMAWTALG